MSRACLGDLPCLLLWFSILIILLTQCYLLVSFMGLVYLIFIVKILDIFFFLPKMVDLPLCQSTIIVHSDFFKTLVTAIEMPLIFL